MTINCPHPKMPPTQPSDEENATTMTLTQVPSPASARVAALMASSPLSRVQTSEISKLVGSNDEESEDDEYDSSLMSSTSLLTDQHSDQPNGVVIRVTKMTSLIENLRCKLSQNRSLRDGRSDSLRSILNSSIDNCYVDESMIMTGDNDCTSGVISSTYDDDVSTLELEANSVDKLLSAKEIDVRINELAKKKFKVDLVPRISKPKLDEEIKENININIPNNARQEAFSTTKALPLHQASSTTSMQKQQRALKCLQDALQIMQSKSSDSSSSTESLGKNPFVERLNFNISSKRNKSMACSTTDADNNRRNRREGIDTRTWLDVSLDQKKSAITASSTFSISPMKNESKSTSYAGPIPLESEREPHVRQMQETMSIIHMDSHRSLADNSPAVASSTKSITTNRIQLEQSKSDDTTQNTKTTIVQSSVLSSELGIGNALYCDKYEKNIEKASQNCVDNNESNVDKPKSVSSRPPLSPKPPMYNEKVSLSRTKRSPIRSPNIFRGVPDKVHCHQKSSTSNTSPKTTNTLLEGGCLDNALVATPHIDKSSTKLLKSHKKNDRSISTKRSCLELGYDSIGATSPAFSTTPAAAFNPLAFEAELLTTPPSPGPLKKQRMFANHDTCVETKESPLQEVSSIASALDDTFVIGPNETPEVQLSKLSERMKMIEKSQATNCCHADIENEKMNTRTSPNQLSYLRDLVKTLENKIQFEREEKLNVEEQRSSIERQLKEEIIRNASIKAKLESEKRKVANVIQEHSSLIQNLQSQISNHDVKVQCEAEMGMTKALAQEVNESIATMKDETLERNNRKLLQNQKNLEWDLQSCATDNYTLRQCLLSHVSEVSAKEQTYAFALSQLNSLSACHYELLQSLKYEKRERKEEVTTLQLKLDKMSRQMIQLNQQNHDLQSENDRLRISRKKQCVEEQRSMFFRRGVRGAYGSSSVVTRYPSQQNNASHHQQQQQIQNQDNRNCNELLMRESLHQQLQGVATKNQRIKDVALMSHTDKIKYMFNIK